MPADEVTHGTDVDGSRERTRARHAAPKKPLFTRFHMPAGKAIASVAMPTAVLMGMGFTSSLALADNGGTGTSNSQKAAEYKDCVKALDDSKDASASPSPSASESTGTATPTPTASDGATDGTGTDGTGTAGSGKTSSPDSGSGDKATPKPTPSSGSGSGSGASDSGSGDTATPAPSATQSSGGGLLDTIGNTIGDIFTGGGKDSGTTASPTPSASSSAPSSSDSSSSSDKSGSTDTVTDTAKKATDTVTDTAKKATDTVKDTTDTASKTAGDATRTVQDAAESATPSPSASSTTSAQDCPAATDDEGGVDNKVPVADDPWYLNASSLLLKSADYQGIVEVKTAGGAKKKVLKYVISGGTDIGDLHQTVKDKQSGKTYHVQAASGSTSTIRGGDTVMYTESISGNLFGLIPVTFSPDSPPPLNIPLIYFTNVKVVQAAQFGGTLHVPGMHVYTTD